MSSEPVLPNSQQSHALRLTLNIHCETPINIGGYGAEAFVDRPFRRDSEGWPFIPASSLKGRLRHECERMARALGEQVCDGPDPRRMCRPGRDTEEASDGGVCTVCRIFGAPWIAGRVYPTDLLLQRPQELRDRLPASTVRYNVSISRRRRVAEDARLFTTELFLPGIPLDFRGEWEADLSWAELALMEAGLGAIVALGRGKTGGMGWCCITVEGNVRDGTGWRRIRAEERAAGRMAWLG